MLRTALLLVPFVLADELPPTTAAPEEDVEEETATAEVDDSDMNIADDANLSGTNLLTCETDEDCASTDPNLSCSLKGNCVYKAVDVQTVAVEKTIPVFVEDTTVAATPEPTEQTTEAPDTDEEGEDCGGANEECLSACNDAADAGADDDADAGDDDETCADNCDQAMQLCEEAMSGSSAECAWRDADGEECEEEPSCQEVPYFGFGALTGVGACLLGGATLYGAKKWWAGRGAKDVDNTANAVNVTANNAMTANAGGHHVAMSAPAKGRVYGVQTSTSERVKFLPGQQVATGVSQSGEWKTVNMGQASSGGQLGFSQSGGQPHLNFNQGSGGNAAMMGASNCRYVCD